MKPTKRTQPYRKGQQTPGAALDAMKRGGPSIGRNPADIKRNAQKANKNFQQALSARRATLRRNGPRRP